MPNLAFHLEVLNQAIKGLPNTDARRVLMTNHKKFSVLGAVGPDLLRYMPLSKTLSDSLDQLMSQPLAPGQTLPLSNTELFDIFRNPLGAMYSVLFRQLVIPVWPVANKFKDFLDKMDVIAQAEDLPALLAMWGPANAIQTEVNSLQAKFAGADQVAKILTGIMVLASPWREQSFVLNPPVAADDPIYNRPFEFLRWHRTGNLALELLNQAANDHQRAYAYGYLSHVSASLIGENFVNQITGGPYRTHWGRNRLVGNFIDSWTYGFFNSSVKVTMNGDEPSLPYAAWKPLCSANLQAQFDVAQLEFPKSLDVPDVVKAVASGDLGNLPSQFPDDLAEFLLNAIVATYPAGQYPALPVEGFTKDTFKNAFLGAYAVYWFMTSGSGPMCDNPLGPPPANCGGTAPSWISSNANPTPQQAGLNVGGATCAVLLAIAAVLLILSGLLVLGVIALIAAMNAPIIDWDKVRCNLFWLRKTLVDMENGLRDMLVQTGFAYPPPQKLGIIDTNGNTQPAVDNTPGGGSPFCRPIIQSGGYPKVKDPTNQVADLNFASYPTIPGAEIPVAKTFIQPGLSDPYPDLVVNGMGLGSNSIRLDSTDFPRNPNLSPGNLFGDAVANAIDLILNDGAGLQNYNLDADRGYGWKTWKYGPGWQPFYFDTTAE